MLTEPLEHSYFNWLYSQVSDFQAKNKEQTYDKLFNVLHRTEFIPLVSGDDNRAQDGKDLRYEFLHLEGIYDDQFLSEGASVFEVLIAFSRHASFMTEVDPATWFWVMLTNLGINHLTDAYPFTELWLADILEIFVQRRYEPNGTGGLFPMKNPPKNQKRVEIWYQFNQYLVDIGYD